MNKRFRILQRSIIESLTRFEERLNREYETGWKASSTTSHGSVMTVLLEREQRQ